MVQAPSVSILAKIGPGLEELVQEVAVGRVDLDAVKAGGLGSRGCGHVVGNDTRQLLDGQGAGSLIRLLALGRVDVFTLQLDRGRGHGKGATEETAVRGPPAVPELEEDRAALGMHRFDDLPPGLALLVRVDSRRTDPADALSGDHGGLADQQTGARPLGVVFPHEGVGPALGAGMPPRHGGQDHAVLQVQVAQFEGAQQCMRLLRRAH